MKRVPFRSVLFGAALAASIGACVDDPDVSVTEEEIIGGFPVKSAKLDAIGSLGFDMGDGTFFPFCSATLIQPTVVLTAEHCVNWVDPSQIRFLIGWDGANPKQVLTARGISLELSVEGGLVGLGADVAIVHLDAPVVGVEPMAYGAIDESTVGRRYTAVGYGQQDSLGTSGTRMAGSMRFDGVGGPLFGHVYGDFETFLEEGAGVFFPPDLDLTDPAILAELQAFYDNSLLLDVEGFFGNGPGDAQVCFGDSGGPITTVRGGKTTVTGVASWVPFADELCRYGSTYATLNPITMDFIAYEQACPMIPREGTCDGLTTAVRCATPEEGGYRELRTDCADLGLVCGVDEAGEVGCVEDPCEGLPPEGTCDGSVATRCTTPEEGPRRVVTIDCADLGMTCGLEDGVVACVDDGIADCTHDVCTEGAPLDPECGSCEAAVCAADPYCCESGWDSICTSEVETYCGTACPGAEPTTTAFAERGIPRAP